MVIAERNHKKSNSEYIQFITSLPFPFRQKKYRAPLSKHNDCKILQFILLHILIRFANIKEFGEKGPRESCEKCAPSYIATF